ncbi:MAG: RNA polymerase sigma factor [Candidatus Paceibacterota bacterium]
MQISFKDEQRLIEQLRQGKNQAVKTWFKLFSPYLLAITLKKVSSHQDAEELVQETFINCLRQLPLFEERSRLKTWMVSILHHEIADFYRKKYAKKALKTIPLVNLILAQPVKDASETSHKVRQVLGRMNRRRKELLLMKYVDKKQIKEIALHWQKTAKSVESELFRAREEFRLLYAQLENT